MRMTIGELRQIIREEVTTLHRRRRLHEETPDAPSKYAAEDRPVRDRQVQVQKYNNHERPTTVEGWIQVITKSSRGASQIYDFITKGAGEIPPVWRAGMTELGVQKRDEKKILHALANPTTSENMAILVDYCVEDASGIKIRR